MSARERAKVTKSPNDKFINITRGGKSVGKLFKRTEFIHYLNNNDIDPKELVSKVEIPDYAVIKDNMCYIIEVKYQNCSGSVDEKLETSPFKIQQFKKMVKSLNLEIKYIYVLNDWFKRPQYKDVLKYIEDNEGKYIFNDLKASDVGF